MSNLWINWRFGSWHLQVGPDMPFFSFARNNHWLFNKPPCWFERY